MSKEPETLADLPPAARFLVILQLAEDALNRVRPLAWRKRELRVGDKEMQAIITAFHYMNAELVRALGERWHERVVERMEDNNEPTEGVPYVH